MSSLALLTALMLACLALAALISLGAFAVALLSSMVTTGVLLVAVWLCLDGDVEVLTSRGNSADEALVTVWPFTFELLLLVVLGEGFLGDFFIEESSMSGFESGLAGGVCAFNFGVLDAADAVVVVIDGCLEDCFRQLNSKA